MGAYITKGSRIRAQWLGNARPTALAGMQMKFGATLYDVQGTVRHVRVDDPISPKTVRFYIDPDPSVAWTGPTVRPERCTCESEHVEINPAWVLGLV